MVSSCGLKKKKSHYNSRVSLHEEPTKNRIYIFIEYGDLHYWTTNSCLVEGFQHSDPRGLSKKGQKLHKNVENWEVLNFCYFRGHFGSLWGHFRHSKKSPKISTNTYRTKLNLRELNSMSNAL